MATSPSNKKYIGITNDFEKRKYVHNHNINTKLKTKFLDALRKYGFENFKWEIIFEVSSWEEACILEKKIIKELNTTDKGYNMTEGGEGILGYSHTEEAIVKMKTDPRRSHKGQNNPRYGKKVSTETRQKISKRNKGKTYSEETKQKMKTKRKTQFPPGAKLTTENVIEIKNLLSKNVLDKQIAKMFDISESTVYYIKTNRTWKNIQK